MSRGVRVTSVKRDWGSDDSGTPILHLDMDAFFVSVELLDKPQLRGKPVAVGGQERGVISAASYEARRFGVNSAMAVAQAKRLCPQLILLPVQMYKYQAFSQQIMNILYEVTPLVEQISVDEAFLDVSGARKLFGSPTEIARLLRRRIRTEVGVPASIGIANTKHLAKLASTHAKPDGMLLVPADRSQDFLNLLPISALWGVGEKTAQHLARRGIENVRDALVLGPDRLRALVGVAAGEKIYALATNRDTRPVQISREEKSFGREQTFFTSLTSPESAHKVLLAQSHEVAARLRDAQMRARKVSIKIRTARFETITRCVTLAVPTALGSEIYRAAMRLFTAETFPTSGIRLLGVRVEELHSITEAVQGALDENPRNENAEFAIDAIQRKYGAQALNYATLVEQNPKNTHS